MKEKITINSFIFNILLTILLFTCCLFENTYGQNHYFRYNSIDVLDYKFKLELNDSTNSIEADASVKISFKIKLEKFILDLKNINKEGKGMIIYEILEDSNKVDYKHQNDQIEIFNIVTKKDEIRTYNIKYHGVPNDGLIISPNKFGDRVFFGDNWPNRAHNWLPTVDHPSDKATVEFIVKVPSHYQVVANGLNIEETNIGDEIISHWKTSVPLSTKLMVIGVARFAKQNYTDSNKIPLSTWVYPQNREEGFKDYSIVSRPLDYFISHIAPYPYSKLANVQSKTIFGGMENASCIFYFENSVTGEQKYESLFIHEIAHQWFGNTVSELNWHHFWLSEGFATYFTDLYVEHQYGKDEFLKRIERERNQILKYANKNLSPVIDTTVTNLMDLINTTNGYINNYIKGAWFLHMLRMSIGDDLFWECIRTFYDEYKYSNALTEDFQRVVETISGQELDVFFEQWLYKSGHPKLYSEWNYENQVIRFKIKQQQEHHFFIFPLEIKIIYEDGSSALETISVNMQEEIYSISSEKNPKEIVLDPNACLLFESVNISN